MDSVVSALDTAGMLDNTLVVFASDNGGCFYGGGKNGPLRGTKATLFEGGTKVDAFIYGPTYLSSLGIQAGKVYNNLFHVTDWFPTLLDFAGVTHVPAEGYALDGVSHFSALTSIDSDIYSADTDTDTDADADVESESTAEPPRKFMVYNSYHNVAEHSLDTYTNKTFAVGGTRVYVCICVSIHTR
jgi:arylsulfatase A-like enzyme